MATRAVVVDAGMAVHLVVPTRFSEDAQRAWERLAAAGATVSAPWVFAFEVASVIRRYMYDGLLAPEQAVAALQTVSELGVEHVAGDVSLCRAALAWAERLQQRAAYDGFYVALTESREAELWTADQRLRNAVQAAGGPTVRWIAEIGSP